MATTERGTTYWQRRRANARAIAMAEVNVAAANAEAEAAATAETRTAALAKVETAKEALDAAREAARGAMPHADQIAEARASLVEG